MATLPRYQNLGVQYADLPKISTAAQQAQVQGFEVLNRSLDRMTSYFQTQAETEAKKQAKKYAVDSPPTQEQRDLASKSGQAPKIEGAGSIFQNEYDRLTAYNLSTELSLEAKLKLASVQAQIDAGIVFDPMQLKADMEDMVDGYAATILAYDPERSLQFKASLVESSRDIFKASIDGQVAASRRQTEIKLDKLLQDVPALIRSAMESAGDTNVDTGKPIDVLAKIESYGDEFKTYDSQVKGSKYLDKFYQAREKEINTFFADKVMDDGFAKNDMERQRKIASGDFGKYSGVWKGLSGENKKAVMEAVSAKIEFKNKVRASFLAEEQFTADETLRQIYMAPDLPTQRRLFKGLEGTAASPSTISAARNFIDANVSDGPKYDNLEALGDLNRKVQAGTATVEDVIKEQRAGNLTKESAKSFVISITNPNTAISAGMKVIGAAVNVQREDLPPDIKDADARSVAVKLYNQGQLDLIKYANTPVNKVFPTKQEILAYANTIKEQTKSAMRPVFAPVIDQAKKRIIIFIPEAAGIDLSNDAAWKAIITKRSRNGATPSDINLFNQQRDSYLNLLKLMQE